MQAQRTSIFLTPADRVAIRRLQLRYGLATMSDALRFSLRLTETFFSGDEQRMVELLRRGTQQRAPLPQRLQAGLAKAQQVNQRVELRLSRNAELLAQGRGGRRTAP
ncbi:MAG TPA: hypothetical protein VKJ47_16055 [Candidatus Binatia bacterium]|nr:hypothetical protein [Candidatus Binatia bacterium]